MIVAISCADQPRLESNLEFRGKGPSGGNSGKSSRKLSEKRVCWNGLLYAKAEFHHEKNGDPCEMPWPPIGLLIACPHQGGSRALNRVSQLFPLSNRGFVSFITYLTASRRVNRRAEPSEHKPDHQLPNVTPNTQFTSDSEQATYKSPAPTGEPGVTPILAMASRQGVMAPVITTC